MTIGVLTESTSAYTWERGGYLVSGGFTKCYLLSDSQNSSCQPGTESSGKKKKTKYIVCDAYYIILNTYLHGKNSTCLGAALKGGPPEVPVPTVAWLPGTCFLGPLALQVVSELQNYCLVSFVWKALS